MLVLAAGRWGHALGEPDDGGLGGGVAAHAGVAFLARHGGDVHDAPVLVRLHDGQHVLAACGRKDEGRGEWTSLVVLEGGGDGNPL